MRENRLRWFDLRRIDYLEIIGTPNGRGRHKKIWLEIFRSDLKALHLTAKIALNRSELKRKINIADPN